MADFESITFNTEEELNEFMDTRNQAWLDNRLKRDRLAQAKKFDGYISPEEVQSIRDDYESKISDINKTLTEINEKYADFDRQIEERDKTIKAYEIGSVKTKIAEELGLSTKATAFLSGETEEKIRESAESLKSLMNSKNVAPLRDNTESIEDSRTDALRKTLSNLNLGGI